MANNIIVAQYMAAIGWQAIDTEVFGPRCGRQHGAKSVAIERRNLRDEKILRDANGAVVKFVRNDMRNTNLMGEIWNVLINWGVVTIEE